MKLRVPLIVLALALPVASAIVIARFALPGMLPSPGKNATELVNPRKDAPEMVVPDTLASARKMTIKRLMHLQKLTQAEWDVERKNIMHKQPPADLYAAIARTQLRLGDLNAMKEADWPKEKEKLIARQKKLQED